MDHEPSYIYESAIDYIITHTPDSESLSPAVRSLIWTVVFEERKKKKALGDPARNWPVHRMHSELADRGFTWKELYDATPRQLYTLWGIVSNHKQFGLTPLTRASSEQRKLATISAGFNF